MAMERHHYAGFYGAQGLFLTRLGRPLYQPIQSGLLVPALRFQDNLMQYPQRYRSLLGRSLLYNEHADQIHVSFFEGGLYAGNDGSEKDGIGAHPYRFTNGRIEGKMWDGAAITPGKVEYMTLLRAERGAYVCF